MKNLSRKTNNTVKVVLYVIEKPNIIDPNFFKDPRLETEHLNNQSPESAPKISIDLRSTEDLKFRESAQFIAKVRNRSYFQAKSVDP